jgi:16S rRNA C1402 N4-methylase RsmH
MTEAQAQSAAQSRLKKLLAMDVAAILLEYGVEREEARRIACNAANEAKQSAGMLRMVKFTSPDTKLILDWDPEPEDDQSARSDRRTGDFAGRR